MSEHTKSDVGDFLDGLPLWLSVSLKTLLVLFLVSILAGLANPPLYWMFLSDRGIGFWGTPGWDLFWEFHTGPIGGTLLVLEFAPYVLSLLALGLCRFWLSCSSRS